MANKVTKRDNFMALRALAEGDEALVAFIDHELELLDKKASTKSQTKTQKENVGLKVNIVEKLASIGKAVTVTELYAGMGDVISSTQKMSALLNQLVDEGAVVKLTDKKRSLFVVPSIADSEIDAHGYAPYVRA